MNWLKQLFSRRRLYNDLSEEIRAHLEEKIVRGSIALEPDATFRTSALRLLASRVTASNTFPALPTLVSNIGPSIP
jgi:hypothetical protein